MYNQEESYRTIEEGQCHFKYIETTYEPPLNLSVPLDESSLEPYPSQNPSSTSDEEFSIKTIVNKVDNCIKIVVGVQNKLSDCTLTLYHTACMYTVVTQ